MSEALRNIIRAYQEGRMPEVLDDGAALVVRMPDSLALLLMLGSASLRLRRFEAAAAWYEQALALAPDNPDALNDLGIALAELGRAQEALICLNRALRLRPDNASAHNNLGQILRDLGSPAEAQAAFERAVALKPDFAEAHNNLGIVLARLGRHDEAIGCFVRSVKFRPGYAEGYSNLGNSLAWLGRHADAAAALDRAIRLNPNYDRARANWLYQCAAICDWPALESERSAIATLGVGGQAVSPFNLLPFDDEPARHRLRAERFVREYFRAESLSPFHRPNVMPARLEIGYFSSDFHDHATMHLIARLFELHDRARFRIHAFSYGQDSSDPIRARLEKSVDVFHPVRELSDRAIAMLARSNGLHIAVDLKGFTGNARTGIFACGAAPIQISYLGYPGTMGAPFMDYILADHTVIPDGQAQHYSEHIIYLPRSYQINDNQRAISDQGATRAAEGLPPTGFVFCCFNQTYKISPAEFDIWMRLLGEIPGSVLWLLRADAIAEQNLRKEAARRGIAPVRIIFADRKAQPAHLARHRLADLFLDTFHYNAHTVASDALWSGLPLVTKIGGSFASRVAASLLQACNLSELVTDTPQAYWQLVLELAQNRGRLDSVKQKLIANRDSLPLFDSAATTAEIERGFQKAWERYFDGLPPAPIDIANG
jgi:predicted O-linked N-acetylglucosamine transferase (SPINDLY family)